MTLLGGLAIADMLVHCRPTQTVQSVSTDAEVVLANGLRIQLRLVSLSLLPSICSETRCIRSFVEQSNNTPIITANKPGISRRIIKRSSRCCRAASSVPQDAKRTVLSSLTLSLPPLWSVRKQTEQGWPLGGEGGTPRLQSRMELSKAHAAVSPGWWLSLSENEVSQYKLCQRNLSTEFVMRNPEWKNVSWGL